MDYFLYSLPLRINKPTHATLVHVAELENPNLNPFMPKDLATLISMICPFPTLWVMGGILHFCPIFNRTSCKQTVKIQTRHRIMRCLICSCTVCLCPIKRTLGLNWLTSLLTYTARLGVKFNPLMRHGISHLHRMNESISNLRNLRSKLQFPSNYKSTSCKQKVQNLIRRRVLLCRIWLYTVCRCPIK